MRGKEQKAVFKMVEQEGKEEIETECHLTTSDIPLDQTCLSCSNLYLTPSEYEL